MSGGPKVSLADIEAEIATERYFTAAEGMQGAYHARGGVHPHGVSPSQQEHQTLGLLTFCVLVLRNGFTVTGESACVSPENFNADTGRETARKKAIDKLWPLLGFRLRDAVHDLSTGDVIGASAQRTYHRCASTGTFVSEDYAKANPDTTVRETR